MTICVWGWSIDGLTIGGPEQCTEDILRVSPPLHALLGNLCARHQDEMRRRLGQIGVPDGNP